MVYGGLVSNNNIVTFQGFDAPDHFDDSFSSDYDGHVENTEEDPRSGLEDMFERTRVGFSRTNKFKAQKQLRNKETDVMDEDVHFDAQQHIKMAMVKIPRKEG